MEDLYSSGIESKEKYTADNIFLHNDGNENYDATQQTTTNEDVLPGEFQLLLPEFFGTFSSSSPSLAPSDLQKTFPSDGLASRASSISSKLTSTTSLNHYSIEELSTMFASSCSSLSFLHTNVLDVNKDSDSWGVATTSHTPLVITLQRILPFRKNKTLGLEDDWKGGEGETMYAVEALSTWIVVSLGLGLWFLLLVVLSKIATTKHHTIGCRRPRFRGKTPSDSTSKWTSNSKGIPNQLRRPSLEQHYKRKFLYSAGDVDNGPSSAKGDGDIEYNVSSRNTIDNRTSGSLNPSNALTWSTLIHLSQDMRSNELFYISGNSNKEITETRKDDGTKAKTVLESNSNFDEEEHEEQEPEFLPVQPVLSDLTMPPGLSKSSSSTSGGDGESSLEVLAADDIYTGNASASVAIRTPSTYYLSYCLEESNAEGVTLEKANPKRHHDYCKEPEGYGYDSDQPIEDYSLLLSTARSSSSLSPSIEKVSQLSVSNTSQNEEEPHMFENSKREDCESLGSDSTLHVLQKNAIQSFFPPGVDHTKHEHKDGCVIPTGGSGNNTRYASCYQGGNMSVQDEGQRDGDCVNAEHNLHPPMGNRETGKVGPVSEETDFHPSLKQFAVLKTSVAPPNNLAMLMFCDDSNTTINLLDESGIESTSSNSGDFDHDTNLLSSPSSPQGVTRFFRFDSSSSADIKTFGVSPFSSLANLKYSRYTSNTVSRKRRLEEYETTRNEAIEPTDKAEGNPISSSTTSIYGTDSKTPATGTPILVPSTKEFPSFRHDININMTVEDIGTCQQVGLVSVQPMTEDLEALLFETEDRDDTKVDLLQSSQLKLSFDIDERDETNPVQESERGLNGNGCYGSEANLYSSSQNQYNGRESALSCFLGSLQRQRIMVALSCVLLILSVMLMGVMGIAELQRCKQIIESQLDDLATKATVPFATINRDYLDLFDQRRQYLYEELDNYCPKISPSLCEYYASDEKDSILISSSSCDLEGVPLGETWSEWLDATGKISSSSPLLTLSNEMNNSNDNASKPSSRIDPYDPLFRWFITARDESTSFVSAQSERFRNKLETWKWRLSIAYVTSVGLALLSIGIIIAMVQPIAEKFLRDNRKKRKSYRNFGTHRIGSSSLIKTNYQLFFCTRRVFATIFWPLLVASWVLGMVFTIATVTTVDICGSEEPNAVVWKLLDHWEETISDHGDVYGHGDGDTIPETTPITEFWKEQLRYCGRPSAPSGPTNSTTTIDVAPDVSPVILVNRIDDLLHVARPIQNLAEEMQVLSSLGIYEDVCGRDIASILQATQDMASQVCNDAEHVTEVYLELTSCDHSSWLPLYNVILKDTICARGMKGLTWTMGMHVLILVFAVVVWTFRSVFLV